MKMYFQIVVIAFLASEISGKFEIFPKLPNYIQYGKNEICKIESDIYRRNLRNYTIWAHKMLDSSAKGTFGVLTGNVYQFGNYEGCLNIQGPFSTQYCLVGVTINVPSRNSTEHLLDIQHSPYGTVFSKLKHYKITNAILGMCFPSSCSASDMQTSLTESLRQRENTFKTLGVTYTITSSKEFCSDYVNPKRFGVLETTFCILSITLVIFVLIGTMGDCLGTKEQNSNKFCMLFKNLCLSFSTQRTWKELFKDPSHQDETKIFNGIRSISVITIFYGHFLSFLAFIPSLNSITIDETYNSKIRLGVEKIDLMVDIFFLMSGLLLVHGVLKKWKTVHVNPIWLIFLRYLRLTPLNLYVTLYFVTMFPYFASGPLWSSIYTALFKSCVQNNNWWWNILYINNFMTDSSEACNEMNWYVSCDFQLFIVGVLIMFVVKKNFRVRYAILGSLLVLSITTTFTITKVYEIVPYMGIYGSDQYKRFWNSYYIKPYTRASCYILGMVGGLIYDELKSQKVKLSKMNSYAVIGISLFLMVVSYIYFMFAYNGQENYMFEFALYNALHRPIWCLGVLGICIVASFGSFPAIKLFLSSSFWTPLAKLTYGVYLIHMIVQCSTLTTSTTGIQIAFLNTISLSFALLGLSYVVSLFLYLIVEAPLAQIVKITILRKCSKKLLSEGNVASEGGIVTEIKEEPSEGVNLFTRDYTIS